MLFARTGRPAHPRPGIARWLDGSGLGKDGAAHSAQVLTRDEVRRLIGACSDRAATGIRNRALITVMYRGGLRVAGLIGLHESNVDREQAVIHVDHPGRNGTVALDRSSFRVLDRWVDKRRDLGLPEGAPLFCTLQGQSLKPSYVRALLSRLAAKSAIDKRVSAEVLRRTLAAELAQEGVPIGLIQAQLGHRSAATTERYLNRVVPDALLEAMRRRQSWLA